jgi:hypothetical protein
MNTKWYKQLLQLSPTSCQFHLETLKNDLDVLREKEIGFYKEGLNNSHNALGRNPHTTHLATNLDISDKTKNYNQSHRNPRIIAP